jgi:anthranilate phosphoribosyltransferase
VLEKLNIQLARSEHLSETQIHLAVEQLVEESVADELKADFLCHLALKGETVEEIASFARALREKSVVVMLDAETRAREILDVVGTGGDQLGTFNISTTAALLCAAAGVTVAKHGNRAATSKCGSADVLEALGVPINLKPDEAASSLKEHGFAFFFAPNYHHAFKFVGKARKLCAARGKRTIFNLLGPLLNPARPSAQLVGVPRPELCEPLARVLQSLKVGRAMVVCGSLGAEGMRSPHGFLDELSTLGENRIAEFYQQRGFTASVTTPSHFPLQPAALADLLGDGRETNAQTVRAILRGDERGPKRDAVLLNTAAALFVAGKAASMMAGWDLAAATIDSGRAFCKLEDLIHRNTKRA